MAQRDKCESPCGEYNKTASSWIKKGLRSFILICYIIDTIKKGGNFMGKEIRNRPASRLTKELSDGK